MNISLLAPVVTAVCVPRRSCAFLLRRVLAILIALGPLSAFGQGNDNPTGFTGVFNGNSTTGGLLRPLHSQCHPHHP